MELKEIVTKGYKTEGVSPFSVQFAHNGNISFLTKTCVRILRPNFRYLVPLSKIQFDDELIGCPKVIPSNELVIREKEIYEKATTEQRHKLFMDQRLISKLTNDHSPQSRSCAWSSDGARIAYTSNYGSLEIYEHDSRDEQWKSVAKLDKTWMKKLLKSQNEFKTFEELEDTIQGLIFSSVIFDPRNSSRVLAATNSGFLVLFYFSQDEAEAEIVAQMGESLIGCLLWFEQFLLVGSLDGRIKIYDIDDTLKLSADLWTDLDHLPVQSLDVSEEVDGRLVVLAVKGSFVLAFLLSPSGDLLLDTFEAVPCLSITGFHKLNGHEYLVAALDASLHHIKVKISATSDEIVLVRTPIKFQVPSGYSLYGISGSRNSAFFVLAVLATAPHDHLVLRESTKLIFVQWSHEDPLDTLAKSADRPISEMMDFVELLRYSVSKSPATLKKYEGRLSLDTTARDFLHRVKLNLVIYAGMYGLYHLNSEDASRTALDALEALNFLIDVLFSVKVLESRTSEKVKVLHRRKILDYVNFQPRLSLVRSIYTELAPSLSALVENLKPGTPETCEYCEKTISTDSLRCEDEHNVPRCCLTQTQVVSLSPKMCPQCMRVVTEDLSLLVEAGLAETKCPLCEIEFQPS